MAEVPAQPVDNAKGYPIWNDNQLLHRYPGALGGKTGYTDLARQLRRGRRAEWSYPVGHPARRGVAAWLLLAGAPAAALGLLLLLILFLRRRRADHHRA